MNSYIKISKNKIIAGLLSGECSYSRESIRTATEEFIQFGNEGMRRFFGRMRNNNLIEMAKKFAERIHFVHLRNVKREGNGSFYELETLTAITT